MSKQEKELKNLIIDRYGTVINFSKSVGLPNSTVASILNRGIIHTTVGNMQKICHALGLDIKAFSEGKLCPALPDHQTADLKDINRIYMHSASASSLDGLQITDYEAKLIKESLDFAIKIIRNNRQQNRQ